MHESEKWKLSHVWLFTTPGTAAYQAPPSMGFSRQEYWRGLVASVGSHSRCDTWEGRQVQIWLCGSVLAPNTGTSQIPNETQSSRDQEGRQAKKRDSCRCWCGGQRTLELVLSFQNLSISSLAVVPKGTAFLIQGWGLRWARRQWWPTCLNKSAAILGSGLTEPVALQVSKLCLGGYETPTKVSQFRTSIPRTCHSWENSGDVFLTLRAYVISRTRTPSHLFCKDHLPGNQEKNGWHLFYNKVI